MNASSRSVLLLQKYSSHRYTTAATIRSSRSLQPTRRWIVTSLFSSNQFEFSSPYNGWKVHQQQLQDGVSERTTNSRGLPCRRWSSFDATNSTGVIIHEEDHEPIFQPLAPFFAGPEYSDGDESLIDHQQQQQQQQSSQYTPEQQRAYRLENERMKQITNRILEMQDREDVLAKCQQPSFRFEVKEAFMYWLSRRAARMEEVTTDSGSSPFAIEIAALQGFAKTTNVAKRLLEWMIKYGDARLVQSAVKSQESCVGRLVLLMHNLLVNFRGTSAGYQRTLDYRVRREASFETLQQSLLAAMRVGRIAQDLIQSPDYPEIQPDVFSCNGFLSLWSRKCWLLSSLGERQNFSHRAHTHVPKGSRLKQLSDCILQMEELIHNMETREDYPKPDQDTYNMLVTALVYSNFPEALVRAREVVNRMNPPVQTSYNALIWGYAMNAAKDPAYAKQARELMFQIQDMATRYPELKPDVVTHSTVLLAYCNAGLPQQAEEYLNEMEQRAEATNLYPNTICYHTVMAAWLKRNPPECLDKVLSLYQRMRNLKAAGKPGDITLDRITYGFIIEAYAKSPSPDGFERAEALLFQTADDEEIKIRPDMITYNKAMSALARRSENGEKNAERVEQIMRRMQRQHQWSPNCYPAPDLASYNCCINAWTHSGAPNALHRVYSLLNEVDAAYQGGNAAMKPNRITFNSVLATVGRSKRPDAVEKAEALLTRMEQTGITRDMFTYNIFLDVLARQSERNGDHADRAMLILKTLEEEYRGGNESLRPTSLTYNTVLKAVGKAPGPDAPVRCERLLQRMTDISKQPNRQDIRPGVFTFTIALDAWSRSGRPDALSRMEKLLDLMQGYATPNLISFNTILNAISRSGMPDAGPRAETFFRKLQESGDAVAPNNFTFSSLIACWARSRIPGAAERAEAYFRKMVELYKAGNPEFRPTAKTYTSLLDAWSKAQSPGAVDRCLEILDEIEKLHATNSSNVRPNGYTYNAVLNCIAKQEAKGRKVERAKEVLARQMQSYESGNGEAAPNVVTFAVMLNACAYSSGTRERNEQVFAYAEELMQQMYQRKVEPNSIVLANFILCCKYLLPEGSEIREQKAKDAFKQCCDLGLLSPRVLEIFRSTVSNKVYAESMVNTINFLDKISSK